MVIAPILDGVSGRGLTHGRAGAGVLRHLILVVRIFRIRDCAVRGDLDPGVLLVLEAELLQRKAVYIRKQCSSDSGRYIKYSG
jgi:hypothetical protein